MIRLPYRRGTWTVLAIVFAVGMVHGQAMSPQYFAYIESILRSNTTVEAINLSPLDEQFPGDTLPNFSAVVRSLRGASRVEAVNNAVDKLLSEIQPLQQSGNNAEVRRRLTNAYTLLKRKQWNAKAEYSASLELRNAPMIADGSKTFAGQLGQLFMVKPSSATGLSLQLSLTEFAMDEDGLTIDNPKVVKVLGSFNGVGTDLTVRPFSFSTNVNGVPEGIYRLAVEVFDGELSVGKTTFPLWLVRDLEARRVDVEKKLAAVQGHDSAKATIRFPFMLSDGINKRQRSRVFYDFPRSIQRSVDLAQALANGKDMVARGRGYQGRHYLFDEAKEIIPFRLYVPINWDGRKKLPMIVYLHGANEDERDALDRDGGFIQRISEERGYIIVAPLGYRVNGGYGAYPGGLRGGQRGANETRMSEFSEKDILNVTEIIAKEYDVDRSRLYLMGQSMGGRGVLYIGAKYAELWAGMVATAPAPGGASAGYSYERLTGIPVMIAFGDADSAAIIEGSRLFIAEMKKRGMEPAHIEVEGATHHSIVYETIERAFDFLDNARKGKSF